MKSCVNEDEVILSPLLFTPSQEESRGRRCAKDDYNKSPGCMLSPATPSLTGLLNSPDLPTNAHELQTSSKSKDNSILLKELLKSNNSKQQNESVQFSSQHEIHDWLFDTPSLLKSSPQVRHKGVSRRSLEGILDPDVSFLWVESMATPPSDSSDLINNKTTEEARQQVCQKSSDNEAGLHGGEDVHSEASVSSEQNGAKGLSSEVSSCRSHPVKKGVARVLFGVEEKESDAVVGQSTKAENRMELSRLGNAEEEITFNCSLSSCEDENFSMSPPVVGETQDNISSKLVNFSQISSMRNEHKEPVNFHFKDASSQKNNENIAGDLIESLQRNTLGVKDDGCHCMRTNDMNSRMDITLIGMKSFEQSKHASSILTSPCILSKTRNSKQCLNSDTLSVSSAVDSSAVSTCDATFVSSPFIFAESTLTSSPQATAFYPDNQQCNTKEIDIGIAQIDGTTRIDEVSSLLTDLSSYCKSPSVATNDFNANHQIRMIKSKSPLNKCSALFQTPEKLSVIDMSGISEQTLSPTVVSSCGYTPFVNRQQQRHHLMNITESTPKIPTSEVSKRNEEWHRNDVQFDECLLSPSVVASCSSSRNSETESLCGSSQPCCNDVGSMQRCKSNDQSQVCASLGEDKRLRPADVDNNCAENVICEEGKAEFIDGQALEVSPELPTKTIVTEELVVDAPDNKEALYNEAVGEINTLQESQCRDLTTGVDTDSVEEGPLHQFEEREDQGGVASKTCMNNIVDMEELTELPYDELDRSFCYKEKEVSGIGVTNGVFDAAEVNTAIAEELQEISGDKQGGDTIGWPGKKEITLDAEHRGDDDEDILSIAEHKENSDAMKNISIRCCEGKSSAKQPCQPSDSSIEDMLEELMFGGNSQSRKGRDIDDDAKPVVSQHASSNASCQSSLNGNSSVQFDCISEKMKQTFTGFFTGSGKKVEPSSVAIEKAKRLFQDVVANSCEISKNEGVNVHENSATFVAIPASSEKILKLSEKSEIPLVNSSATSGNTCTGERDVLRGFSEKSLQHAQKMLDCVSDAEHGLHCTGYDKHCDLEVSKVEDNESVEDALVAVEDSFLSRKRYHDISDDEKAILSECMLNNAFDIEDFTQLKDADGCMKQRAVNNGDAQSSLPSQEKSNEESSNNNLLNIPRSRLKINKQTKTRFTCKGNESAVVFYSSKDSREYEDTSKVDKIGFSGFTTGSGKKVEISTKAIQAAKKKLESIDVDDKEDVSSTKSVVDGSKFGGFCTGSGKKVEISAKAIQAAKKKLESIDVDVKEDVSSTKSVVDGSKFGGFCTGSGKKVEISAKAMQAAKKKLESIDVDVKEDVSSTKSVVDGSKFVGFCTGSGKKVEISAKAMQAAKKKLESIDVDVKEDVSSTKSVVDGSKFVGFCTGSGKKVEISAKAMQAAKKKLESIDIDDKGDVSSTKSVVDGSKFGGFCTGSGKKVEISAKAMQAAKKKLESIDVDDKEDVSSTKSVVDGSKFGGFCTGSCKKVEISAKAIQAAKKKLESIDVDDKEDVSSTKSVVDGSKFVGFCTGSGKKVEISAKAMQAAKKKLESIDVDVKEDVSSTKSVVDGSKFVGFCTGSGKKVEISAKAMQAAKKKLESIDIDDKGDVSSTKSVVDGSKFVGFCTGSGKKVEISAKAMQAAKKKLESIDVDDKGDVSSTKSVVDGSKFGGFCTGSGKKVEISAKAMQAAKKKLESIDVDVEEDVSSTKSVVDGSKFGGFCTGSGKKVEISAKAMQAAKKKLESIDVDVKEDVSSTKSVVDGSKFGGFCTGSGKKVEISAKAMQAAKKKLESIETNNEDNEMKCLDNSGLRSSAEASKLLVDGLGKSLIDSTPKLRDPFTNCDLRRKIFPVDQGNEELIEMSERFDEDMMKTIDEDPCILGMKRKQTTDLMIINEDEAGKENETPGRRPKIDCNSMLIYEESSTRKEASLMVDQTATSRRRFSGLRSKSKFVFKAETTTPSGYHNDRVAKFTTPLEENKCERQAGRLFTMKRNSGKNKRLSQFCLGRQPGCFSRDEAYNLGVSNKVIDVTSDNAHEFIFNEDFFSAEALAKGSVTAGDGAVVHLNTEGSAGFEEFKTAFRSLPGVENSLFVDDWVANHYRWIVWKLASMERSYPGVFAGRCLTPNEVMYQLKYRYDKEIDAAERPALKKILERDDISSRRLVLCVSKIYPINEIESNTTNETSTGIDKRFSSQKRVVELTDGWYPVKTCLDKPLSSFVNLNHIRVGTKLCIYGSELIGSEQAIPPLEAPDSLMLVLHANSVRRAFWDAKLGFQTDRRAFPIPLYSLYPDGGLVGCIDVIILRSYPVQWMEKTDGGCIFRNFSQEQKAAKKYCEEKQIRMEKLYAKIQKDFDNSSRSEVTRKSRRNSLNPSAKEINNIRNGKELYDLLNMASDPSSLEMMLSDSQKELVARFRLKREDDRHSLMQRKFDDAWKEVQADFADRSVVSLQKFRVTDHQLAAGKQRVDSFITVWKPKDEMREMWKEGARLKIFNLSASASRYKHCRSTVQLATINTTRYEELKTNSSARHYSQRKILPFSELKCCNNKDDLSLNEIDVVGYVVHIDQNGTCSDVQTVYLADLSDSFVAVKLWGGLKTHGLEDTLRPGALVCMQNLVLKSEYLSECDTVAAVFCDLSSACRSPKESSLRKAVTEMQANIKDATSFIKSKLENLATKLPMRGKSLQLNSTPTANVDYKTELNSPWQSITEKQHQRSGGNGLTPINLTGSGNVQKRLNNMKRRALARYGEPDCISSPSAANITPRARRAFKPPTVRKM
eukprot:gene7105-7908_t